MFSKIFTKLNIHNIMKSCEGNIFTLLFLCFLEYPPNTFGKSTYQFAY